MDTTSRDDAARGAPRRARRARWGAALLCGTWLVAGSGCAHVTLDVPPRDAPLGVRQQAWERLKPAGAWTATELAGAQRLDRYTLSLELAGGQSVADPADLLPAVLPDSRTAREIASFSQRQRAWNLWGGLAGGTFGAGVAMILGASAQPPGARWRELLAWTGIAVGTIGPLVFLGIGAFTVGSTDAQRDRCFKSYGTDLRDFLGLEPLAPPAPATAP